MRSLTESNKVFSVGECREHGVSRLCCICLSCEAMLACQVAYCMEKLMEKTQPGCLMDSC